MFVRRFLPKVLIRLVLIIVILCLMPTNMLAGPNRPNRVVLHRLRAPGAPGSRPIMQLILLIRCGKLVNVVILINGVRL